MDPSLPFIFFTSGEIKIEAYTVIMSIHKTRCLLLMKLL